MRRVESEELLDHGDVAPADRDRSLRDLRRINRFFGGHRAYQSLIQRLVGRNRAYSILDLGTGTSDLLESLSGATRIGLDFKLSHLTYDRINGHIRRVAADALTLPFRSSSVDLVGSSHFFHHFSPDQNASILAEALRVARVGVFVTDTKRHPLTLAGVWVLTATGAVGRVTRHDAMASVRQGYTAAEVEEIARRVAANRFEIVSVFPFRFGLLLWKSMSR